MQAKPPNLELLVSTICWSIPGSWTSYINMVWVFWPIHHRISTWVEYQSPFTRIDKIMKHLQVPNNLISQTWRYHFICLTQLLSTTVICQLTCFKTAVQSWMASGQNCGYHPNISLDREEYVATSHHCQNNCLGSQKPCWPLRAALRQLVPKRLIQGAD